MRSGISVRTLITSGPSLTHSPERSCCDTVALVAVSFHSSAADSAGGATYSPMRKISATNTAPIMPSERISTAFDMPEARITVISEFLAIVASAYSVPISTAIGINS